jgi:hypothetical protein
VKRVALLFVALIAGMSLGGCAEQANEPTRPAIAEAWQARCGNCHVRVEPHSRTHAELESAFSRHKSRTHLSNEEWRALEDFLASDSGTAKDSTSSVARR